MLRSCWVMLITQTYWQAPLRLRAAQNVGRHQPRDVGSSEFQNRAPEMTVPIALF